MKQTNNRIMKKRWNKLTAGVLLVAALMVGGWVLNEGVSTSKETPAEINMEEVLVVRP